MEIKMDYAMMAEMKQAFQQGAEDLDDTMRAMNGVAQMLEDGGLVGDGGSAFCDALTGSLANKLNQLINKFEELGRDIQAAVESMREADSNSSSIMG